MKSSAHRGRFPSGCLSTVALSIILVQWLLGLFRTNSQLFLMLREDLNRQSSNNAAQVHFLSARFQTARATDAVEQLENFTALVRKAGIFDDQNLHVYTKIPSWITNDHRWSRHLRFLHNSSDATSHGAGYQFWKPLLLLHQLQDPSVRDGDFVIYVDPSRTDVLQWIALVREVMTHRKADLTLEQHAQVLERQHTKPDIYYHYLCRHRVFSEQDNRNSKRQVWQMEAASDVTMQYDASFVVIRRNPKTLQFVQDWADAAQKFELISDEKSGMAEAPDFQSHHHDQSLLSVLLKCKYGEPGKSMLLNNTSLRDTRESHTFTFQVDGPVVIESVI